jgi:hypothetical protein
LLAVKVTAYLITGSLALYSDALESIINVATSIAAIIAIRIAARPADAGHPYGYHKAEYVSAVVIGARGNLRQCHRCYRRLMPCEPAMQARPPSSISIWWFQGYERFAGS